MSKKLAGKRALVTGGSRGIGAAIARRLAADGADVVITYAGNHEGAQASVAAIEAEGVKGKAIQADAADKAAVQRAVDEAATALGGGIDILVHNAAVATFAPLGPEAVELYDRIFGVNVEGVLAGTAAALPYLGEGARVILVSSVSAETAGFPGNSVYAASKAAVSMFAKTWAHDLGSRGILVNAVQPGPIDTDMNPADSDFAKTLTESLILKRYGRPDEVAGVVAFLAGDDATYITGATIDVSGGAFV
jgi:3-oxoacyl-[acyl-carrier protein] reductase